MCVHEGGWERAHARAELLIVMSKLYSDKRPKIQRQKEKDAKLAEALRANLRKRKTQKKQWEQDKR